MKAVMIQRYGGPEVVEYRETEAPKPRPRRGARARARNECESD